MRSDLIITRIPEHTEAWYEYRKSGIGGSEIGTILGLDKYNTVARTFHEKIGTVPIRRDDNEFMFWGRKLEDDIAEVWSYYDGTTDGYIENFKNNRIIRSCRNINGYIVNPKYPWLFASIDRLINIKGGCNLITSKPLLTEGILECKGLSYWAAQIWADNIPINYLLQIHQYMIILETDYAEIALLQDGNKFRVESFQLDEGLAQKIIEISKAFWYNRVVPGKEAFEKKMIAERTGNIGEIEKYDAVIQKYEPEPDNTEAYTEFMSERFLKERETVEGTMELYDMAKKDKVLSGLKGLIDDERNGIKNTFIHKLTLAGAEAIDFGKLGSISWSERKGSKNRTLTNRLKEKPSEDQLLNEFKKLDLECF